MNKDELLVRQQTLLARSSKLRHDLITTAQVFKKPLAVIDGAKAGLQWLYRHPQWPLSAILVLIVLRPKRAISWGGRAWSTWQTYKRVQNWIATQTAQDISRKSN